MEILPVLEHQDRPQRGRWYSVIPGGVSPGVSVGHTCMFIPPGGEEGRGSVLIVGGANPNGSFSQSHILNLDTLEWRLPAWGGLSARYEHCSFVTESRPQTMWVFAGAEQEGNRNCIQNLRLGDGAAWKRVEADGVPPSPRTYHTTTACIGDTLYVFSGGETGATPVSDTELHVFNTLSSTWSQPATRGRRPSPRHGHAVVAVGSRLYIHGGMTGEEFHSDMYSLDTVSMTWRKIPATGEQPPGVAAHAAVILQGNIYIFGGLTSEGASNAMYRFNCDQERWVLLRFEGDLPPNRLDHSMCLIPWRVKPEAAREAEQTQGDPDTEAAREAEQTQGDPDTEAAREAEQTQGDPDTEAAREAEQTQGDPDIVQLLFVFAGMDTQGIIHSDCVGTLLN